MVTIFSISELSLASCKPRVLIKIPWVLQSGDRVRRLRVSTGRRVGDRIEITGGLVAGARVANDGAGFLNDGDKVRVVTAGGRAK